VFNNNLNHIDEFKMTGNTWKTFGRGVHVHGEGIVYSNNTMESITADALYLQPDKAGAMVVGNQFFKCGVSNANKCVQLTNQHGGNYFGAPSIFMGNILKECGAGSSIGAGESQRIVSVEAKWIVHGNTITNPKGSNTTGRNDKLYGFYVDTSNGASIIGNYCHLYQYGFTCTSTLSLYYFSANAENATCMGNIADFRANTNSDPKPSKFNGLEVHSSCKYSIFAFNSLLPLNDPNPSYDCDFIWADGVDRCIWIGNLGRNSSIEIGCSSASGERSFAIGNMVWQSMAMSETNCYETGNHSQSG
jgi:hypothetical protein